MLPFKINQIDHIVLRVPDLERSIAFYRDVVGCSIDRRRPELGMVHMRAGTSLIDLVDIDSSLGRQGGSAPAADNRNVDHFCLRVDPFDEKALIEHLAEAGVSDISAAQERYGAEGTGLSLYFHDPDGNQIELKGPSAA